MQNTSRWKHATAFLTPVVALLILFACGDEDSPSGPDPELGFDFSVDLIAFRSERDGQQEIYLITPDGSEFINITVNSAADAEPAWSPDGAKIAFSSNREGQFDIFVMNVDGTGVTRLTDDAADETDPT